MRESRSREFRNQSVSQTFSRPRRGTKKFKSQKTPSVERHGISKAWHGMAQHSTAWDGIGEGNGHERVCDLYLFSCLCFCFIACLLTCFVV